MTDKEIAKMLECSRAYGELAKDWARLKDYKRAQWAAEDSCKYISKIISHINW